MNNLVNIRNSLKTTQNYKIKIMSKYIHILMLCILAATVTGCSNNKDNSSNKIENIVQTECINGIEYYTIKKTRIYKGWGFMSPKYNRDGSISLCD